ncbi:MAG: dTDP-4-dehydrorhamnose reductase [Bacteroidales bacterium]|nr:MAG: dTDP-4-dehydrorhamnose reductase [Bacteroidales bacterium]
MDNDSIKVLVTGSNGQLGSEIKAIASTYPMLSITFTDIEDLDITDEKAVNQAIQSLRPRYVINCAAFTAVDKAEVEVDLATKLNSVAPSLLAKSCKDNGCKMIHVSTDYVFDGESKTPYDEHSQVNPVSQYGISKLNGEKEAFLSGVCMVIRTSWLYSSFGGNFVKTIIRNGKIKPELRVVSDQVGCPTYARDLADLILKIVSKGHKGFIPEIFHYSNEGVCSWYDFACEIIKLSNLDCNVMPIGTIDYPLPAKRPQYSVFNKEKIIKSYHIAIPQWKESLGNCIKILKKEGFI